MKRNTKEEEHEWIVGVGCGWVVGQMQAKFKAKVEFTEKKRRKKQIFLLSPPTGTVDNLAGEEGAIDSGTFLGEGKGLRG